MKHLTLNQYAARLDGCAGFVLLELVAQPENGIGNLQDVLAKSERTIERAVFDLEQRGLCTRDERFVYLAPNWAQICGISDAGNLNTQPNSPQERRIFDGEISPLAAKAPQNRGENAAEAPQERRKNAAKMTYAVFDTQFGNWGDYRGEGFRFCFLISSKEQDQEPVNIGFGGSGGDFENRGLPGKNPEQNPATATKAAEPKPKPEKPPKQPKPKAGTAAAAWLEWKAEHGEPPEWLDLDAWLAWLKDLDARVPFVGSTIGRLQYHLNKLEKIHFDGLARVPKIENAQKLAISAACGGKWKAPWLPHDLESPTPPQNPKTAWSRQPRPPVHNAKADLRADVQYERLIAELEQNGVVEPQTPHVQSSQSTSQSASDVQAAKSTRILTIGERT